MKYFTFVVIGICFSISSYCQVVKGIVLDKPTGNPIGFASVYFDGSTVGTITDQNGFFKIDISKHLSVPLIISALGYYSTTVQSPSQETNYEIRLTPKTYDLGEVVISSKSTRKGRVQRKRNLELFSQQFLGNTMNAKKCEILNSDDISFKLCSSSGKETTLAGELKVTNDTLKAFASCPIIVVNRSLGYKLTFFLDRFEYSSRTNDLVKVGITELAIDGHVLFEELTAKDQKEQMLFEKKRKSAFLGSRMHFIRSLYENKLDSAGFKISGLKNDRIMSEGPVIEKDSLISALQVKYIKSSGDGFAISYYSKSPSSFLLLNKGFLLLNRNQILNPAEISWLGEISIQRIGDLLPDDYELK